MTWGFCVERVTRIEQHRRFGVPAPLGETIARSTHLIPEDFPPRARPRSARSSFYDLRHTGHTLSTRSGATLKDTMVRAGQSSEKAASIYQHSDDERQREVAAELDEMVRAEGAKHHKDDPAHHRQKPTGS